MPEGIEPQDLFSPFENVILKNFWVWNRIMAYKTYFQFISYDRIGMAKLLF